MLLTCPTDTGFPLYISEHLLSGHLKPFYNDRYVPGCQECFKGLALEQADNVKQDNVNQGSVANTLITKLRVL